MPKSPSPKKAGAPKVKGAVHAKSGCTYTCRISNRNCNERPDRFVPCEICFRLHLQCLGFGATRPDWLRENNNMVELREKIKQFHTSQGYSAEQEQLADDHSRNKIQNSILGGGIVMTMTLGPGTRTLTTETLLIIHPQVLLVQRAPSVPLEMCIPSMEDIPSRITGGLITTSKLVGLITKEIT
ncbi:hypothetical protein K435DRAFT_113402 [Dendrothele bispora CBS 962.96]|uniref:Uncharacterized protein n=1 Tax=Dendrothele bispora (strain CBS 962.96) TaxID=1314807 RepID=A0A4S8M168_DENBC|nr:hypothetical protein K435DRAFT_113402 [Dendrothele bispora CBS 962.96]